MTSAPNRLATSTWPQVESLAGAGATLLVPLGSTEQHGPHLPIATDTLIAEAIAERAAADHPDVVVAPALPFGSSGEHAGFAGTLSIGTDALHLVLVELVRSLGPEFARAIFVNGHGGNTQALQAATAQLVDEGHACHAWWPTVAGGDAHAGRTETSLMLAIAPELVQRDLATAGATEPLGELLPRLRTDGLKGVTSNGVLGDPTGATAAEGEALLDALAADLASTMSSAAQTDALIDQGAS